MESSSQKKQVMSIDEQSDENQCGMDDGGTSDSDDSDIEKLRLLDAKCQSRLSNVFPSQHHNDKSSVSAKQSHGMRKSQTEGIANGRIPVQTMSEFKDSARSLMEKPTAADKNDKEDECKDESDFEDLAAFWNDVGDDFLSGAIVEGAVIDDPPTKTTAERSMESTGKFHGTVKEPPHEVNPNRDKAAQDKEGKSKRPINNPYKNVKKTTKTTTTNPSKVSGNPNRGTEAEAVDVSKASLDTKTNRPPQENTLSPKIHHDEVTNAHDDEWLDLLLGKDLPELDNAQSLEENRLNDTPISPMQLDDDAIAEAFGFEDPAKSSVSQSQEAIADQRIQVGGGQSGIHEEDRRSEVHPDLYAPFEPPPRTEPMVHHFNETNTPKANRQRIPVRQIFDQYHSISSFFKYDTFNHLQSALANVCAFCDDNVVLSAPTGAGTYLYRTGRCSMNRCLSKLNIFVLKRKNSGVRNGNGTLLHRRYAEEQRKSFSDPQGNIHCPKQSLMRAASRRLVLAFGSAPDPCRCNHRRW